MNPTQTPKGQQLSWKNIILFSLCFSAYQFFELKVKRNKAADSLNLEFVCEAAFWLAALLHEPSNVEHAFGIRLLHGKNESVFLLGVGNHGALHPVASVIVHAFKLGLIQGQQSIRQHGHVAAFKVGREIDFHRVVLASLQAARLGVSINCAIGFDLINFTNQICGRICRCDKNLGEKLVSYFQSPLRSC